MPRPRADRHHPVLLPLPLLDVHDAALQFQIPQVQVAQLHPANPRRVENFQDGPVAHPQRRAGVGRVHDRLDLLMARNRARQVMVLARQFQVGRRVVGDQTLPRQVAEPGRHRDEHVFLRGHRQRFTRRPAVGHVGPLARRAAGLAVMEQVTLIRQHHGARDLSCLAQPEALRRAAGRRQADGPGCTPCGVSNCAHAGIPETPRTGAASPADRPGMGSMRRCLHDFLQVKG